MTDLRGILGEERRRGIRLLMRQKGSGPRAEQPQAECASPRADQHLAAAESAPWRLPTWRDGYGGVVGHIARLGHAHSIPLDYR